MKPQILSLIVAATLGLTACGDAQINSVSDGTAVAAPNLTIEDPYVFRPLKGRDVTAGFFKVTGGDTEARLVAAESPFVDAIELHTHTMTDGVMQMRKVDGIDIPAGETVFFQPGGLHLMLFGLRLAEEQDAIPVTLTFEDGSTIDQTMPLRDRS